LKGQVLKDDLKLIILHKEYLICTEVHLVMYYSVEGAI